LLLGTAARAEIPLAKSDNAEFDAGGMIQVLGFAQHLDDPYKDDARLHLFMNPARAVRRGRHQAPPTEVGLAQFLRRASTVAQDLRLSPPPD